MKKFSILVCLSCLCTSFSYAQVIDCDDPTSSSLKKICSDQFKDIRQKLDTQSMTAFLISDAPQRLLVDTHELWLNRLHQCKSLACYQQQMDFRIDDLNFYTSLNQSLTQHYLKFEHGTIAKQPVHLQVHQLSKDKIKIEGIAYRSPHNRIETQTISFLAYTTPDQKQNITGYIEPGGITWEDIEAEMFKKHESGQMLRAVDPNHERKIQRMMKEFGGDKPYERIVG